MAARIKPPVLASAACAAALVPLVLAAYGLGPVERLDASLLLRTSAHAGPAATTFAEAVAHLADPLPLLAMILLVCGLGVALGRRPEAVAAAGVVVGANLTTQMLKVVLAHPREAPLGIWSTSFPSGHETAAASIAIALVLVAPPRWRAAAALAGGGFAALVAVSVVALEWHYPSDVLGAVLVAACWGFAAMAVLRGWRSLRSGPGAGVGLSSPAAWPSRRSSRAPGGWPASHG
ncbi:MAG TPA: phosphatase PAP2 family protein [Solirubrobacterales bacterium]